MTGIRLLCGRPGLPFIEWPAIFSPFNFPDHLFVRMA